MKTQENTPENPAQLLEDLIAEMSASRGSIDEMNKLLTGLDFNINKIETAGQNINFYTGRLQNLLQNLPVIMEMKIPEKDQKLLETVHNKLYILKTVFYLAGGLLLFGLLNLAYVNKLAVDWFDKAIRTEKEMLVTFEKQNRIVVDKTYLRNLEDNTAMMKEFIRKKPNDAEKLLDFQSGYQAKK